jgi:diacylglycerol kinase (ATP)
VSEPDAPFSLAARARSFRYAGRGLVALLRREHNARIHAAATVVALTAGGVLGISPLEWCAVAVVIAGVWAAEAFNTALEALADAASPRPHPKVALAKDVAAGAVLVWAVAALVVAAAVFGPRLLAWISSGPAV